MNRTAVAIGVVLLFVVLVPATSAAPVAADLEVNGPAQLGPMFWTADDAFVYLEVEDTVPTFTFTLDAERADVHVYIKETNTIRTGVFDYSSAPPQTEEQYTLEDVSLNGIRLGPAARLMLDGDGRGFHAEGGADSAALFAAKQVHGSVDPKFSGFVEDEALPYFVGMDDQIVMESTGLSLEGSGNVRLDLWDTDIDVSSAQGDYTFESGETADPDRPSVGPYEAAVRRIVWIDLHGVTLQMDWGSAARVAAPSPLIETATLALPKAAGLLNVDGLELRPSSERLEFAGSVLLQPKVVLDAPTFTHGSSVMGYEKMSAHVDGDASDVSLSGAWIRSDRSSNELLVAAGAGVGILAAAAAVWRLAPLALAALYSRLDEGDILANPTRARIYDVIRQNPGVNPRKVQRLADASWGTVMHHLRKLVDAGLVAVRKSGRAKCFYENHGKWDGFEEPLALLAKGKARQIAATITGVPGRDQGDIVGRTGFSQSTVSYHLLKLEKVGLTSKERINGAWCYYPTQRLRDILARTSSIVPDAAIGGTA